jgi:hypothetical protein
MPSFLRTAAKILAVLVVAIALGIGWLAWSLRDGKGRIVPIGDKVDMVVLPKFVEALEKTKEITVFEGLPHQRQEPAELKRERRSKKCVKLHGYWFYGDARVAADEDFVSLRQAMLQRGGIFDWGGAKLCGGYHPDYLIRWRVDEGTYDALVCFGCHEIKLFGPKDRLYADLSKQAYEQLERGLSKFRKHRP